MWVAVRERAAATYFNWRKAYQLKGRLPDQSGMPQALSGYLLLPILGSEVAGPPRILAEEYGHSRTVNPAVMESCLDLPAFQTHPDQLPQAQTQFCLPGA